MPGWRFLQWITRKSLEAEIRKEITSGDEASADLVNVILKAIRDKLPIAIQQDVDGATYIVVKTDNAGLFKDAKAANIYNTRPSELYDADETVAQSVSLDCLVEGKRNIEIYAKASVATDFTLDGSVDNTHFYTIKTYSAVTSVHEGFLNATRYIKLSSAAAGVAGDLVDLIVTSM